MVQSEVEQLANRFPNTTPALLDITRDADAIEKQVAGSDLVISLLPYAFHPRVAAMCIRHKRNMVTASYRSPEILQLHNEYVFPVQSLASNASFRVQSCTTCILEYFQCCGGGHHRHERGRRGPGRAPG